MDAKDQTYRDLQKHLDNKIPNGFKATKSGAEIRLLRQVFTPEEAKIALQLSMRPEPINRIYKRVKRSGMSKEELQKILDRMAYKGTLLVSEEGYSEKHYSNVGFGAGGTYDFQVDRLTEDLVRDFHQHLEEAAASRSSKRSILPLRTIPIEKSIPLPEKYQIGNYDNVRKIVENVPGPIAVANCVCRQGKDLIGERCSKTDLLETCLMIGPEHAKRYVDMGIGRYITKEETLNILSKAQEAGLILQPENSLRPEAICCCCGDCCALLSSIKHHPRPASLYVTNYYAEVIPELCTGCKTCVERCQMGALDVSNGTAEVNLDRCIGCGNCVVVCPTKATQLKKKENETIPPKNKEAYHMKVLSYKIGKWNLLKIRTRMFLGLRV
jgi:Fe-S-cluster-containing hydrogenase component 2